MSVPGANQLLPILALSNESFDEGLARCVGTQWPSAQLTFVRSVESLRKAASHAPVAVLIQRCAVKAVAEVLEAIPGLDSIWIADGCAVCAAMQADAVALIEAGGADIVTLEELPLALARQRRRLARRDFAPGGASDPLLTAALIDHSTSGIVAFGADGSVVQVNQTFRKLIRAVWPPRTHADDWGLVDKRGIYIPPSHYPFMRTIHDGVEALAVCGTTDGKADRRWLELHSFRLPQVGREVTVVAIDDVTERDNAAARSSEAEHQLRHAQKIQTVGVLAGGIAHDFNNILAPMCGYVDLSLADPMLDGQLRSDLTQVRKGLVRARDLVQQIVAFSGQSASPRRPVEIGSVVMEALKLLRATMPSSISIRSRVDPEMGSVWADETQIHQIVVNLCTNASHAMTEGGTLSVDVSTAEITADQVRVGEVLVPGPYSRVRIRDTGSGMAADVLQRIFDPFFTTKTQGKGTGLGLSVVHGIVTEHLGAIRVESALRRGTTFDVYLPITTQEIKDADPVSMEIGGTERVLFVDDERDLVDIVPRMLRDYGYDVRAMALPTQALATFRATPEVFDVVITDYTMPRMTGLALAREIKLIRPGVPIVLVTGFRTGVDEAELRAAGIDACLIKPLGAHELARAIRKVCAPVAGSNV